MSLKVAVFVNGQLRCPGETKALASAADLVIAANGGSQNARSVGIRPNVIVGDLDSLSAAARIELALDGAEMIQYPEAKDETDLELALLEAVARGADEIVVLTALGGRTDQMLANILLLALPALEGIRACIADGVELVSLVRDQVEFVGRVGDVLSLIPLGRDCHDIWTQGLQYPLAGDTLWLAKARGISNVFTQDRANVRLGHGTLLAIHRSQEPVSRWPWEAVSPE